MVGYLVVRSGNCIERISYQLACIANKAVMDVIKSYIRPKCSLRRPRRAQKWHHLVLHRTWLRKPCRRAHGEEIQLWALPPLTPYIPVVISETIPRNTLTISKAISPSIGYTICRIREFGAAAAMERKWPGGKHIRLSDRAQPN